MNKIRKAVLLALTALIVIVQAGCAGKTKEPVIRHNFYFDTVCSIAIYDMADMSVQPLRVPAFKDQRGNGYLQDQ